MQLLLGLRSLAMFSNYPAWLLKKIEETAETVKVDKEKNREIYKKRCF